MASKVLPPEKALPMATLSKIEISGMMAIPIPTSPTISLKPMYVPLVSLVENGGGLNGGKPASIFPENMQQLKSKARSQFLSFQSVFIYLFYIF